MSATTDQQVLTSTVFGHSHCLMCGSRNPNSLGLSFRLEDDGSVSASFQAHDGLQGYDGIMHGGFIAALLDSAMTNCLFLNGVRALTGELKVRYRKPVPSDALVDLRAWSVSSGSRLFVLEAELSCSSEVMATARAKFMLSHRT